MIDFVLYRSRALRPFRGDDDQHILVRSRNNNQARSLTGFLWRARSHYLQYFEGPAISCEELLVRLSSDPRHDRLRVLARGRSPHRRYGQWDMGFERVVDPDLTEDNASPLAISGLFPGALNAEQVLSLLDEHAIGLDPMSPDRSSARDMAE